MFFGFSLTNSKFSVNICSFLGFPSVEIKSDDGYQIARGISSDNHRPILYHVISFIQWEPAEIIRWVINIYLTIILRGRAGYEMIYNQRGAKRRVGYDHFISSEPEENNCFIKNPTTHNWESEEKKRKKVTQLQRKPKERNHFPIKCNKQKGRQNLSMYCNVFGQSWMNSIGLAEENVRVSLLKKLLYLSVLNCCKWSLVS